MKPLYIYIENFLCYAITELDLSNISSALIIGKNNDNDNISNGVGKSTLFRAIEYVLFNEARGLNLEEIIRDDMNSCKIIFDFALNGQIWRISRSRTRKGVSDLSLYQRIEGPDQTNPHTLKPSDLTHKLFWEDLSSRRTGDTENDLGKLIKTNYKAFANAFLFAQNDFNSGLANITPSKRRTFFRESLPIGIYGKLEKLAKEKSSHLQKELDKKRAVRDNFPDFDSENLNIANNIVEYQNLLTIKTNESNSLNNELLGSKKIESEIKTEYTVLQTKLSTILSNKRAAEERVQRLNKSLNDSSLKKKSILEQAKNLVSEIKSLKDQEIILQNKLNSFESEENLKSKIELNRNQLSNFNSNISILKSKIEELEVPMPNDAICRHCRQELTEEHKRACLSDIQKEIKDCKKKIEDLQNLIKQSNLFQKESLDSLKELENSKKELESCSLKIQSKQKESKDKKVLFEDYSRILDKEKEELALANQELDLLLKSFESSNEDQVKTLKSKLDNQSLLVKNKEYSLAQCIKEINDLNTQISVANNNLSRNDLLKKQKKELEALILGLEEEYSIYPDVIESFSSTGIPNSIIKSLLDELQAEANNILNQIKPSLQLGFSLTKTKSDKTEDEDLEINYYYNNKIRSFGAISGAMQLSVMFALKIGYAFLLYKKLGTDIKFIMLDEVDMPLDKASIDALADILKFFQKEFSVFIISHNDRSKEKLEKIGNVIVVEQDHNMTSRARLE